MTKRWLSFLLVLTLLLSCFTGATAAEIQAKVATTLPEIFFTAEKSEIVAPSYATTLDETILGRFSVNKGANIADAVALLKSTVLATGFVTFTGTGTVSASITDAGVLKASVSSGLTAGVLNLSAKSGFNNNPAASTGFYVDFLPEGSAASAATKKIADVVISDPILSVGINAVDDGSGAITLVGTSGQYNFTSAVVAGYKREDVITLTAKPYGAFANGNQLIIDEAGSDDVEYAWSSSAPDVVSVAQDDDDPEVAELTTLKTGQATITVAATNKATGTAVKKTFSVVVNDRKPSVGGDLWIDQVPTASWVYATTKAADVQQNKTLQLTANFASGITAKGVTWSSSNESVATVSTNGLVTAKAISGTAVITATSTETSTVKDVVTITATANNAPDTLDPLYILLGTASKSGAGGSANITEDTKMSFQIANDATNIKYILSTTAYAYNQTNGSAIYNNSAAVSYTAGSTIDIKTNGTYYVYAAAKRGASYTASVVVLNVAIDVQEIQVTASPTQIAGRGKVALTAVVSPSNALLQAKDIAWSVPSTYIDTDAMDDAGIDYTTDGSGNILFTGATFTIYTTGNTGGAASQDLVVTAAASTQATKVTTVKMTKVDMTGITVTPSTVNIPVKSTVKLATDVVPTNAPKPTSITYAFTDNFSDATTGKFATLSGNVLTGVTKGSEALLVTATFGGVSKTFSVVVNVTDELTQVPAPTFSVDDGKVFTAAGSTVTLSCSMVGAEILYTLDGTDPMVSSSAQSISPGGDVAPSGNVTLPNNQKTTIRAFAWRWDKNDSAVVSRTYTVEIPVTSVTLADKTENELVGSQDSETYTATIAPANAKDLELTFSLSDPTVAKVEVIDVDDEEHTIEVTPLKPGTTVLKATSANGKSDSFTITVKESTATIATLTIAGGSSVNKGEWIDLDAVFWTNVPAKITDLFDNGVNWSIVNPDGITAAEIVKSDATSIRIKGLEANQVVELVASSNLKDSNGNPKFYGRLNLTITAESSTVKQPVLTVKTVAGEVVDLANTTPTEAIIVTAESPTADAKLYYTTNGTTPTSASTEFPADGLKLTADCLLSVIAIKGTTSSTVKQQAIVFNFAVKKVTLDQTSATIVKGKTLQLSATLTPPEATATYVWTTDSSTIATVDSKGLVTAKNIGSTKIKVASGGVTAECTVTVVGVDAESLTVVPATAEMEIGDIASLTSVLSPANADAMINWVSSNPNVVAIQTGGQWGVSTAIQAKAVGTATITASYGTKSASCIVTVVESTPQVEPTKLPTLTIEPTTLKLVENTSATQLIGQFTAGSGETWKQIAAYYNVEFVISATDEDGTALYSYATANVSKTGAVTLTIPNAGKKAATLNLTWRLIWKTTASGTAALNGNGATGRINVTIINKPTEIKNVDNKVGTINGDTTKSAVLGTLSNYADFVATGVQVTPVVTGLTGATATIGSDGKVTLNIPANAPVGEYDVVVTVKADGCPDIVFETVKVVITQAPTPVTKAITVTSATKPYEKTANHWILARADGTVKFDVPGYTVSSWTSSKKKIISIASDGTATLKKVGTKVVIKAKLSDGTILKKTINVAKIATDVKLQYKEGGKWKDFATTPMTVAVGAKKKMKTRIVVTAPKGGKIYGAKWTMGDPTIASYSKTYITGLVAGSSTTVSVELYDGRIVTGTVNVVATKAIDEELFAIDDLEEEAEVEDVEEIEEVEEIEIDEVDEVA